MFFGEVVEELVFGSGVGGWVVGEELTDAFEAGVGEVEVGGLEN